MILSPSDSVLVKEKQPLSVEMEGLLDELRTDKMNVSSALARVGLQIGSAVYGLAVQMMGANASHTLVTWSRSGQDPQRVRKTLTDRLRMGGILEVECGSEIPTPLTSSVIQFAIRSESGDKMGWLAAFVEHHELSRTQCKMLCDLSTVLSIRFTSTEFAR